MYDISQCEQELGHTETNCNPGINALRHLITLFTSLHRQAYVDTKQNSAVQSLRTVQPDTSSRRVRSTRGSFATRSPASRRSSRSPARFRRSLTLNLRSASRRAETGGRGGMRGGRCLSSTPSPCPRPCCTDQW